MGLRKVRARALYQELATLYPVRIGPVPVSIRCVYQGSVMSCVSAFEEFKTAYEWVVVAGARFASANTGKCSPRLNSHAPETLMFPGNCRSMVRSPSCISGFT